MTNVTGALGDLPVLVDRLILVTETRGLHWSIDRRRAPYTPENFERECYVYASGETGPFVVVHHNSVVLEATKNGEVVTLLSASRQDIPSVDTLYDVAERSALATKRVEEKAKKRREATVKELIEQMIDFLGELGKKDDRS